MYKISTQCLCQKFNSQIKFYNKEILNKIMLTKTFRLQLMLGN